MKQGVRISGKPDSQIYRWSFINCTTRKNGIRFFKLIPKDPVTNIFQLPIHTCLPENNLYIIQCLIDIKRELRINLKDLLTPKFPE